MVGSNEPCTDGEVEFASDDGAWRVHTNQGFQFPEVELPNGRYNVRIYCRGYWPSRTTVNVNATTAHLPLIIDGLSDLALKGKVIWSDSAHPVERARVIATHVDRPAADRAESETNPGGEFTINNLPSGTYKLAVAQEDGDVATSTIFTVTHPSPGEIIVVLPAVGHATITGRVDLQSSSTVSGLRIIGIGPHGQSAQYLLDVSGYYRLQGLPGGEIEVRIVDSQLETRRIRRREDEGFSEALIVFVDEGSFTVLDLAIERERLRLGTNE
jgi:hypothetical protein